MHATTVPDTFEIPPRLPRQPLRWRRAWQSFRALIADPDDTARAIDFFYAVGTGDFERSFQRLCAEVDGRRLLARRPSLLAALADRDALTRLPEDSLGRAYLAYLERTGFDPGGLLEVQERVRSHWEEHEGVPRLDPAREWFRDRSIVVHDLFHVLSGYGTDEVGEATLLAFSQSQFRGRANALLTLGAAFEVWQVLGWRWLVYLKRAWRRGARARWLTALPLEELLPQPLDAVRRLAAIEPAEVAHPEGIWAGSLDELRGAAA